MDQMETKNADLLYAIIKACNTTIHLVLVYFSIPNKQEDKARNKELRKEIETILDEGKKTMKQQFCWETSMAI